MKTKLTPWADAVAVAATFASAAFSGSVLAIPILPDFASATFTLNAPIDNAYFPLLNNQPRVYTARDSGGNPVNEGFTQSVIGAGPTILGVATVALRDRASSGGRLDEDTFDYFAQDTAGNVWYFGEDVTNYVYDAAGVLVGTNDSSSWRAGVNGAKPGYAMRAAPTVGDNYYQEFAEIDEALDVGETTGVGLTLVVNGITYTDVVQIFETSPLLPDFREFKYYAAGTGLILAAESLDVDRLNPELNVGLTSPVPEPSSALLLLLGIPLAAMIRRRKLR